MDGGSGSWGKGGETGGASGGGVGFPLKTAAVPNVSMLTGSLSFPGVMSSCGFAMRSARTARAARPDRMMTIKSHVTFVFLPTYAGLFDFCASFVRCRATTLSFCAVSRTPFRSTTPVCAWIAWFAMRSGAFTGSSFWSDVRSHALLNRKSSIMFRLPHAHTRTHTHGHATLVSRLQLNCAYLRLSKPICRNTDVFY